MSKVPKPPEILDRIVDLILAHKPKRKAGEKKAVRRTVDELNKDRENIRERQEQIRKNAERIKTRIRRGD
jgi:hypothetical protein